MFRQIGQEKGTHQELHETSQNVCNSLEENGKEERAEEKDTKEVMADLRVYIDRKFLELKNHLDCRLDEIKQCILTEINKQKQK